MPDPLCRLGLAAAALCGAVVLALPAAASDDLFPAPEKEPRRVATTGMATELFQKSLAGGESGPARLRLGTRRPERDWRDNMARSTRPDDDDDACLLGFSLGGVLAAKGYKGVRLFGVTRTLVRPASQPQP